MAAGVAVAREHISTDGGRIFLHVICFVSHWFYLLLCGGDILYGSGRNLFRMGLDTSM